MNRISGCQKEKQLRRPKLEGVGQKKKERKTEAPMSVLCGPPRSGVFIAVVADRLWTPFLSQSESFS